MWEADFGSVDCAIPGRFDDGEKRCELGVCDDLIDRILVGTRYQPLTEKERVYLRTFNPSIVDANGGRATRKRKRLSWLESSTEEERRDE